MENRSTYTHSSKDVELAKKIRSEFTREESDINQLKALKKSAENKASIPSLLIGILSALVFGTGMSLCLIGSNLIPGIVIGLIGLAGAAIVPVIHSMILKAAKARIEDDVIRLSDKIINN